MRLKWRRYALCKIEVRSPLKLLNSKSLFPLRALIGAALFLLSIPMPVRGQAASVPTQGQDSQQNFSYFPSEATTARDLQDDNSNPSHPVSRTKTDREQEDSSQTQADQANAAVAEIEAPPPNAPIVREIEVTGVDEELAAKARRAIHSRVGEPLDPVRQREDIKRLYDQGDFSPNIQIRADNESGGVKLVYTLQPNPKVGSIAVSGNTKVPTRRIVSELPVKEGEVYSVQAQNKIRDSIAKYYEEGGYADAVVRVDERVGANNTVDLDIVVDEGTKIKIKDLVIQGNDNYKDLLLKMRVENRGSWGPFKHYFNESKFQRDLDMVRAMYINKGYLDVDVRRGDFIYAPDQSWVNPVIDVTEGQRYTVGRVDARGYSIFTRDEVVEPFTGLQGKFYSSKSFGAGATKVQNLYGDEGFLQAKVDPDYHKDPTRAMVDVIVDVDEGPRIYVGDVRVVAEAYPDDMESGWLRRYYSRFSPPVKDEVVRREVQLQPGQVYRRFEEVRTRERLKSLQVFEKVEVNDQLSADPCVRDCVVDVTQGNTGNILFGVGFGDVEGAFVYGNYVEHNLFGMARDLKLSAMVGSKASSFEVSYLDRYFMGSDLAARFSVYLSRFLRPGDLEMRVLGGSTEFSRPKSDTLRESIRLRLDSNSFDLGGDGDDPAIDLNDYVAATVRYRLASDTRDDSFFPTSGRVLSGSIETGAADGFLLKLEGQYARYTALGDGKWVWASNNQIGLLPYNADNIGYADRFFMGGSGDLRGFELAGAGPHDANREDLATGGATKLVFQNELRYGFTDSIAGVLFADIGSLSDNAFDPTEFRASVGVGGRLRLPIAQVAVDIGVPVIKKKNDQTQIFQFNMTSAF